MAASDLSFSPELISDEVKSSMPMGFTVRPLERGDYKKGFFECLQVLSNTGNISEAQFDERFDWVSNQGKGVHFHIVIEHEGRIVGTGMVLVERKFIHNLGLVGHVEEIAISKAFQGKGLGLRVMKALKSVAQNVGCYKSTLGTSLHNVAFYEKCGFENRNCDIMAEYYENIEDPYMRG